MSEATSPQEGDKPLVSHRTSGARAQREAETFTEKFVRKFKRDPLIPIGFALILGVLGRGLHALYVGNREASYRMMRYRVLFQGGTIVALVFGMYYRPNSVDDPAVGKGTIVDKRFFLDYAKESRAVVPVTHTPVLENKDAEELK